MKNRKNCGFTIIELLVVVAIIAMLILMVITPIAARSARQEREKQSEEIQRKRLVAGNLSALTITVGNNSYIAINLSGTPEKNAKIILEVIAGFEKNNPEKKIVAWSVDGQQRARYIDPEVFGLWISHQPKNLVLEQ